MQSKVGLGECRDPKAATRDSGSTPALTAAQEGHTDSLHVLVQSKADCDKATTKDGATAALAVARNGHTDSMQVLVHVFGKVEPEVHELISHM
jgi:hypothetical protein